MGSTKGQNPRVIIKVKARIVNLKQIISEEVQVLNYYLNCDVC